MGAEANEILKMNLIRLVAATQSYLTTNVICFTGGGKGAPPYRQLHDVPSSARNCVDFRSSSTQPLIERGEMVVQSSLRR